MQLTKEYTDKLSHIEFLGNMIKKLMVIKNIFEDDEGMTITGQYDQWDEEWSIIEVTVEKYAPKRYWKHWIVIRIDPNYTTIEVDINENQTLTDIDEMIAFFRDIHFDKYVKGIDEIEEKLNVF